MSEQVQRFPEIETCEGKGRGAYLPMELEGENLLTHLRIVVEKIDPSSSSKPQSSLRDRSSRILMKKANGQISDSKKVSYLPLNGDTE